MDLSEYVHVLMLLLFVILIANSFVKRAAIAFVASGCALVTGILCVIQYVYGGGILVLFCAIAFVLVAISSFGRGLKRRKMKQSTGE